MKTIAWNHPFRFKVAIYEGDHFDIDEAKALLKKHGFHFTEKVTQRRHLFTVDVTLHNVHNAVQIFQHDAVLA